MGLEPCPVDAIFQEEEVPEAWRDFVAVNRAMALTCPPIVECKEPLTGAKRTDCEDFRPARIPS